jgi:hypothetical protein
MENEINKILSTINKRDIRLNSEIEEQNNEVIDMIYSEFSGYKNNKENKENSKQYIKKNEYEYVSSIDDMYSSDMIIMFDLNEFFNLKFKNIGFYIKKISNDIILVKSYKIFVKINIKNKIIFRKLSSKDKVKIMLLETINNLK